MFPEKDKTQAAAHSGEAHEVDCGGLSSCGINRFVRAAAISSCIKLKIDLFNPKVCILFAAVAIGLTKDTPFSWKPFLAGSVQ